MKTYLSLVLLIITLGVILSFQIENEIQIPTKCIAVENVSLLTQNTHSIKTLDSSIDFWKIDEEF